MTTVVTVRPRVIILLVTAIASTGCDAGDGETSPETTSPTVAPSTFAATTPPSMFETDVPATSATTIANTVTPLTTLPSVPEAPGTVASTIGSQGGVDGPVIYIAPASMGEDAAIQGVLTLEKGCLFIGEGEGRAAVAWPFGTRWQDEPPAVIGPTGVAVEVGSSLFTGGGFHADLAFFASDPVARTATSRCVDIEPDLFIIQHPFDPLPHS